MKKFFGHNRLIVTLITTLLSPMSAASSGHAAEKWIQLEGRTLETCQYFTTWSGKFAVTYSNHELPWGTKVELVYGFHGWTSSTGGEHKDWLSQRASVFPAIAPFTWKTEIDEAVATRSQNWFDQLQFVLKVSLPDGHEFYEKGNESTWGYYTADLLNQGGRGCLGDDVPLKTMNFETVEHY